MYTSTFNSIRGIALNQTGFQALRPALFPEKFMAKSDLLEDISTGEYFVILRDLLRPRYVKLVEMIEALAESPAPVLNMKILDGLIDQVTKKHPIEANEDTLPVFQAWCSMQGLTRPEDELEVMQCRYCCEFKDLQTENFNTFFRQAFVAALVEQQGLSEQYKSEIFIDEIKADNCFEQRLGDHLEEPEDIHAGLKETTIRLIQGIRMGVSREQTALEMFALSQGIAQLMKMPKTFNKARDKVIDKTLQNVWELGLTEDERGRILSNMDYGGETKDTYTLTPELPGSLEDEKSIKPYAKWHASINQRKYLPLQTIMTAKKVEDEFVAALKTTPSNQRDRYHSLKDQYLTEALQQLYLSKDSLPPYLSGGRKR